MKKPTKSGVQSESKSLVDRLDLFAIGLDSLSANLDRSNYSRAHSDKDRRITRRLESVYRVSSYGKKHFDITATLFLRFEVDGLENPILSLDIAVSGHFHPKTTLSRTEVERFANAEARLIFWPYFRQIASDTTGRMHIVPVTLPLAVS